MTSSSYPDNPTVSSLGSDVDGPSTGATTGTGTSTGTSSKDQAKDKAKQTASTAADEGKQVAGVAQQEAKKVAAEATSQISGLLDQTTSQLEEQGRTQRDRLVETLRSFGDDLEKMASQSDGNLASNVAQEVADRTRGISSHLDGREPRELLDDVRGFASRKPGVFLAGALVAGVVAGRLARGAKDAKSASTSGSPVSSTPTTSTTRTDYLAEDSSIRGQRSDVGDPLAGGLPQGEPVYPHGIGEDRR